MSISVAVNAGSFEVSSPSPGTITIQWENVGFQSFINERHENSGSTQQHTITSQSGSVLLSRLSGEYNFTLFDCRETSIPPGSNIICIHPAPQRTVTVEPICSDHTGSFPDDFNSASYTIYRGDFDNDNQNEDLLIFGTEQIILIHGDIVVPIVLPAPTGFKMIKQNDGSYIREAAEFMCEGNLHKEYDESSLTSLIQSGAISQVSSTNIQTANFNNDGRDDFIIKSAGQVSVIHWSSAGPELVSQLNIPSNYRIELNDVNNDGRSDIEVYNGSEFIRVFVADNQGRFSSPDNDSGSDSESKGKTIEMTWQLFSDALKRGDHTACMQYLTPNFSLRFADVLDVLGDEAGDVIDQVESIAPYYSDEKVAIYLVKKLDDNGEVNIHTMTFQASDNGSWKIEEM